MTLRKIRPLASVIQTQPDQNEQFARAQASARLVGLGFRCWLAGYETNDIDCWETGWNVFAMELGPTRAKTAVGELSCWVREVHKTACRRIETYPFGCKGFCRDECMAISMIAASQHAVCPAMRACAFALIGTSAIDDVVETATSFGNTLRDAGHMLSHNVICDATMASSTDRLTGFKH